MKWYFSQNVQRILETKVSDVVYAVIKYYL